MSSNYFIGWDVGAWRSSKGDAIWILNQFDQTVPSPWSGNLQKALRDSKSLDCLILFIFKGSGGDAPKQGDTITIAIDAPLGFPVHFRELLDGKVSDKVYDTAIDNYYLYRETERIVHNEMVAYQHAKPKDLRAPVNPPFSAIQNMIGSQATKAIHFLRTYGFKLCERGIWRTETEKGVFVTAIETYPATCKERVTKSNSLPPTKTEATAKVTHPSWLVEEYSKQLANNPSSTRTPHEEDALICALIARMFERDIAKLYSNREKADPSEGWIWFPRQLPEK